MVMRFDDSVAALNVHVWVTTEHFCDMPVALAQPVRPTLADAQCAALMRVRELNIVQAAAQKKRWRTHLSRSQNRPDPGRMRGGIFLCIRKRIA